MESGLQFRNYKNITLRISTLCAIFYALFAFWTLNPYFAWSTYLGGILGSVFGIPVRSIFAILASGTGIINVIKTKKGSKTTFPLGIGVMVVSFVLLVVCGGSNNSPFDTSWVSFVSIAIFFFMSDEVQVKTFKIFLNIYVITLIPSLIYFIIENILRINIPYSVLRSYEEIKQSAGIYYKHRLLCSQYVNPYAVFNRYSGIYYEAGIIGTISALLLAASNYKFIGKGRWREKILLVSGIFSVSLSFILLTAIYFVCSNFLKGKLRNAILLLLAIVCYVVFVQIPFNNPVLASVQQRVTIVDYALQGDNRASSAYEREYEKIFDASLYEQLFGKGKDAFETVQSVKLFDGSSYKSMIYDYGLIGFGLYVGWFVFATVRFGKRRKMHLFVLLPPLILQLANIYQRPGTFTFYYILIFIGSMLVMSEDYSPEIDEPVGLREIN